ncbi:MAG: YkoF family thiamine/hydroxymethylpyrimidine-binding protein [Caldisericia bacterium]|nr:YkoF family thiamine/hydroxymethylpyrimidine-binding protein [Caldisericia bacterium]
MIGAQISIYPLKEKTITETLNIFWEELNSRGIQYEVNSFATIIWMEEDELFKFLNDAYKKLREKSIVMVITISNVCPKVP